MVQASTGWKRQGMADINTQWGIVPTVRRSLLCFLALTEEGQTNKLPSAEETPAAYFFLDLEKDLGKFPFMYESARMRRKHLRALEVLKQVYHFVERFLMQHFNGIAVRQGRDQPAVDEIPYLLLINE